MRQLELDINHAYFKGAELKFDTFPFTGTLVISFFSTYRYSLGFNYHT